MSYQFDVIPPAKEVEQVVKVFFKIASDQGVARKDFLLPDGLPSFFYLQSAEPIETTFGGNGTVISLQSGFYVGYSNTIVEFSHAGLSLVGASVYPVYFNMIFGISPSKIINRFSRLEVEPLLPVEKIMHDEAAGVADIVKLFENYILQQLTSNPVNHDFVMLYRKLTGPGGYQLNVEALAERMGYSTRYLHLWFKQSFGMSPKQFMKLVKFNQALKYLYERTDDVKLSDIAHDAGYHDQSHFIRDFKSICGKTPKEIWENPQSLSSRFRLF